MPQLGPWGSILIRAKPTGSSLQSYSSEREWIVKDFKPLLARPSHYFFLLFCCYKLKTWVLIQLGQNQLGPFCDW